MLQQIWYAILWVFGQIRNYDVEPKDDLILSPKEEREESQERQESTCSKEEIEPTEKEDQPKEPAPKEPGPSAGPKGVLLEPFDGPLDYIPKARYGKHGMYSVYGRPPKEKSNKEFPKARMTIEEDLPGIWNNSSGRLYVLSYMGPYLRESLRRCGILGVLSYFVQMGSYNHRRIRHQDGAPFSTHAWGAAVDFNTRDNRPRYRSPSWKDVERNKLQGPIPEARYGPIPPPFSRGWNKLWPKGVPYLAVLAFKSVGFEWGGDWGRHGWQKLVEAFGDNYDESTLDRQVPWIHEALTEWETITFIDPMHMQLKWERDRDDFQV